MRKQNDISSRLSNISLKLYEKLIKVGYVKSDEDYKKLTKFFYSRMPKIKIDNLGFKEQILYYKAWVWYSLITQDFLSSYKYASKWVAMFEKNPEMINIHPVFYLKGTNYLLEALTLIKYPVKFKKTLIQLINNIESKVMCVKFHNSAFFPHALIHVTVPELRPPQHLSSSLTSVASTSLEI